MPLYEYECDRGHRFERIVKFSDPPLDACPECGAPVHKLMSSPAIQFKGTGWYVTDYARKSGDTGSSKSGDSKSGETKSADAKESKDTKSDKPAASSDTSSSSTSSTSTPSAKTD
jgi:putative FmdB family regulatory protein